MQVSYQSSCYAPSTVVKRYVCKMPLNPGMYCFCEVNAQGYNTRTGVCVADDIPAEIREKADKLNGGPFSYVEWPM